MTGCSVGCLRAPEGGISPKMPGNFAKTSKNARIFSKRSKNARAFQISQVHGTYRTTLSRFLLETRPVSTGQVQNARNKLMTASFKTHDPWFPKNQNRLSGARSRPQDDPRGHDDIATGVTTWRSTGIDIIQARNEQRGRRHESVRDPSSRV